MTLQETLKADMIAAMKAKETETLRVLRNVISAVKNAEIDHKGDFDDAAVQAVVAAQVKQLKDALAEFEKGGREDLASQNRGDIAILETYLPAQLTDEELSQIVSETLAQMGITTKADMGKAMGAVMAKVAGRADGTRVKIMVSEQLV